MLKKKNKKGQHPRTIYYAKRRLIAAVLLCFFGTFVSFSVVAIEPGLPASASAPETIVLTPARVSQPQSEAPASVTVIDRALILASGARELYEVLQLVPGMTALPVDGNVPTVAYHATQARDARRMLVLLDGRSQYLPGLARVNWNDIPVDIRDVERIEVTRGPAAATYGANAFAGVINIITRDPRDRVKGTFALQAGNNGILDGYAAIQGQVAQGDGSLSISRRADDGFDEPYTVPLSDAKRVETLSAEWLRVQGDNTFTVQTGGSLSRLDRLQEGDIRDIADYTHDPVQRGERLYLALQWERMLSQSHQLKLSTYAQYNEQVTRFGGCFHDPLTGQPGPGGGVFFSQELRDLFLQNNRDVDATFAAMQSDPATLNRYATLLSAGSDFCGEGEYDIHEERYDLEIQDTLHIGERIRLLSGANLRQDRGRSAAYLGETQVNDSARLFGNMTLDVLPNVIVNVGGFWEKDQISGEHFSPRTGVNWHVVPGHTLRYVHSRAVRTPDIYEARANIDIGLGNLSSPYAQSPQTWLGWSSPAFFAQQESPGTLEAERIRSEEVGYFGQFSGVELDVRVFRESLTHLLSHGLNVFTFEPNNEGWVDLHGSEAQLTWRPSARHLLRASGAHIHAQSNKKTELRLSARDSASALWSWQVSSRWGVSATYYLAQDYNDHTFERVDTVLRYRHKLGKSTVEWQAVGQHALNKAPVVFEENRYQEDRFWIGVSVTR